MTDQRRPRTAAGRALLGSIYLALQQEGADTADLDWVDQVGAVEAEAARGEEAAPQHLNVERLVKAAIEADRMGWSGPTLEARRQGYAERTAAAYARLAAEEAADG